jgi:riboflavin synthase
MGAPVFTGLIAEKGRLRGVERDEQGAMLMITCTLAGQVSCGDSVAVNGVCLTATQVTEDGFQAQAMIQTLKGSSLGSLQAGSPVNLELPLRADGRLGGHIVQGHVDGTGVIEEIIQEGFARVLKIAVKRSLCRYMVLKGSVAVNGVSLTISGLTEDGFSVSLIPETLERTNLGEARVGDELNVEVDVLAKHLERLMETRA